MSVQQIYMVFLFFWGRFDLALVTLSSSLYFMTKSAKGPAHSFPHSLVSSSNVTMSSDDRIDFVDARTSLTRCWCERISYIARTPQSGSFSWADLTHEMSLGSRAAWSLVGRYVGLLRFDLIAGGSPVNSGPGRKSVRLKPLFYGDDDH